MRLKTRFFLFLFFFCTGFTVANYAALPFIEQEKLGIEQAKRKSEAKQVTQRNPKTGKRERKNFKSTPGPLAAVPIFLNPLFSQLHFLRPKVQELPDSLGV